jgi:GT2 family glycosyltransferase
LEANAEFVLLLDDDNRVEPETIATLRRTWQELSVFTPADNLCVVAFRPDHMPHILEGRPVDILHSSPNAFFGFHVKDIPRKIWKWMPRPKRTAARNDPNYAERLYYQATAPYGGMFFHRSVLQRHGLPDARYVLYHDDLEFSYRISSSGGAVVVDPRARIEDLERSWGSGSEEKTTFGKIVDLGSDRQIYYTARNLAYFESHRRTASWIRQVNRAVWFFIVWGVARLHNRRARFLLIHRAIRDGEKSVLGINPAFPLA